MLIGVLLASLAFSVPFSYTIAANVGSYPDDSHRERSAIYVNSWAVKIRGKSSEADVVAQRNGFQNLGLVSLNHQPLHNNLASAGCRIFWRVPLSVECTRETGYQNWRPYYFRSRIGFASKVSAKKRRYWISVLFRLTLVNSKSVSKELQNRTLCQKTLSLRSSGIW